MKLLATLSTCLLLIHAIEFADSSKAKVKFRNATRKLFIAQEPNYKQEEPRCGEWLKANSGGIYYKAFEPVIENERCVWIIGVPNGVGYQINIQYLGSPTNAPNGLQELILTGVVHGGAGIPPVLTSHKPTETGIFTIANAHIVVVTFHTEALNGTPGTGFVLQYEVEALSGGASPLSTHHILTSPTFEFKYPVERATYGPLELAAFVFPPLEHQYKCQEKHLWYKMNGLDTRSQSTYNCADSLFKYLFNVSSVEAVGHWEYVGILCKTELTWQTVFDDIVLIIFKSDASYSGAGFWTSHVGC